MRTFIIAEAGVNHDGLLDRALALVDAAVAAGADAVKFQTFDADSIVTSSAPKAAYQVQRTDPQESQREMLRRYQLDDWGYAELWRRCKEKGIEFLSTPFDADSVEKLDRLGVRAFKIASGELTNLPLLLDVAARGKPVYLSTGMSTLGEVGSALRTLRAGGIDVTVLHCTSAYPAAPEEGNLLAIHTIARTFQVPVGYSDHTTSLNIPVAAVALGASVIEKHLTLDRRSPGPDHAASLEPTEFAAMVRAIREVERALGDGIKRPMQSELGTRLVARKSLVAARPLPSGTRLRSDDLSAKRPGTGISPTELGFIVGRVLRRGLEPDQMLEWADL